MHRNAPLTFKHPGGGLREVAQPNREPSGLGALALVLVVLATIIGLSTWSDVRRESLRKQLEHARGREVHLAGQLQTSAWTSTRSRPRTASCGGRSTPSGGASEGNRDPL